MPKLTVEFNDKTDQKISALAREAGLTKVDILRRAISLYDYAQSEVKASDKKKLSITQDGKTLKDIVLP